MQRAYTADVCPACGLKISTRLELPFSTKKAWRERVADHLGYDRQFIVNLGMKTRIHRYHFSEDEIVDNKPVGLPRFNILRIDNWPDAQIDLKRTSAAIRPSFDDVDDNTNDTNHFHLVHSDQLKLLTRHCYVCGNRLHDDSIRFSSRGGIVYLKYWCGKCSAHRYWKSYEYSVASLMTGASILAGVGFAKILNFFFYLQCAFPCRSALFASAKSIVHPIIKRFYEEDRRQIINEFIRAGSPIDICMDGQYDNPGYCASYCTVSALEAKTGKLIGFSTVRRCEANNRSPNTEPLAFRLLLTDLLSKNIHVASVTTDNSSALNKLFREEYPNIRHHLDLYHILREMYHKFAPKLNRRYPNLKRSFTRITKYIWHCGSEQNDANNGSPMVERCLSTLLHLSNVHKWNEGRFVDIFHENVGPRNFPEGRIQEVWMRQHLCCDHENNTEHEILDNNSLEFDLLANDLCSNLRLQQFERVAHVISTSALQSHHSAILNYRLKRYVYWNLDIRNMLAVLHHNKNIDAENSGEQIVIHERVRVSRANDVANLRIQKMQVASWQLNIMHQLKMNEDQENELEELEEELQNLNINHDEIPEDANFDEYFIDFFYNIIV